MTCKKPTSDNQPGYGLISVRTLVVISCGLPVLVGEVLSMNDPHTRYTVGCQFRHPLEDLENILSSLAGCTRRLREVEVVRLFTRYLAVVAVVFLDAPDGHECGHVAREVRQNVSSVVRRTTPDVQHGRSTGRSDPYVHRLDRLGHLANHRHVREKLQQLDQLLTNHGRAAFERDLGCIITPGDENENFVDNRRVINQRRSLRLRGHIGPPYKLCWE